MSCKGEGQPAGEACAVGPGILRGTVVALDGRAWGSFEAGTIGGCQRVPSITVLRSLVWYVHLFKVFPHS